MSHRWELGALVAVGNTATIHEWGADRVVKVMLPGTPPRWADLEAESTARVHAVGLPVPEVFDVIEVDGRRAIVSQRIVGPTMLARVAARPAAVASHARALAELQAWFHAVPAPPGLPSLRARMTQKIEDADLPDVVRDAALARLAALPDGRQVCHGDLHPGNVIHADGGFVVVDWFDAAAGAAPADVARTSLLVRPRPRTGPPQYLPHVTNALLHEFHEAYLDAYTDLTGDRVERIVAWELPVAAARMSEDVEHDVDLDVLAHLAGPAGGRDGTGVIHGPGPVVPPDPVGGPGRAAHRRPAVGPPA